MAINLHLPGKTEALRPTITVVGVGGAGGNAVNNMINSSLEGVNFVVANTDAQALENSMTERRIQLGINITRGLGAGASPEVGRAAAEEALDEIAGYIDGSNMVFITAGMGGGTGTGAAPVIARLAKERGILTVGVVTKPFQFEGAHRMRLAEQGLHDLQQYVDTLIVIPNQNLFRIANEKTTFADAFRLADEVLHSGVRGVTDLMIMPGLINLDFADIRTVMREMGKAMMGTGEAEGAKRAVEAAEAAISNPLLDDVSMKGARGVLINITGGYDMTLYEADEAATRIREEVDPDANIIFGATFNPALEGKIRVSVVATGIDAAMAVEPKPQTSKDANRFYAGKIGFGAKAPEQPKQVTVVAKAPQPVTYAKQESVTATFSAPLETRHVIKEPDNRAVLAQPSAAQPFIQPAEPADFFNQEEVQFSKSIRTAVGAASHVLEEAQEPLQAVVGQSVSNQPSANYQRTPSFVSPAAAQPAQRTFFAQQSDLEFNQNDTSRSSSKISPRDQASSYDAASDSSTNTAMNFFQRMAGVGRVLTSKPEQSERSLQVVEKPKADITERSVKAASEDDYLEIPAFLRRQAN